MSNENFILGLLSGWIASFFLLLRFMDEGSGNYNVKKFIVIAFVLNLTWIIYVLIKWNP